MSTENIYRLISFDEYSATPKYLQLIHCITKAVNQGELKTDYILPSINDLSYELDMSPEYCRKGIPPFEKNQVL